MQPPDLSTAPETAQPSGSTTSNKTPYYLLQKNTQSFTQDIQHILPSSCTQPMPYPLIMHKHNTFSNAIFLLPIDSLKQMVFVLSQHEKILFPVHFSKLVVNPLDMYAGIICEGFLYTGKKTALLSCLSCVPTDLVQSSHLM